MIDTDTFLTTLYVMVEDFCKERLPQARRPGPAAWLSCCEVVTLAMFGKWARSRVTAISIGMPGAIYALRFLLRPLGISSVDCSDVAMMPLWHSLCILWT